MVLLTTRARIESGVVEQEPVIQTFVVSTTYEGAQASQLQQCTVLSRDESCPSKSTITLNFFGCVATLKAIVHFYSEIATLRSRKR